METSRPPIDDASVKKYYADVNRPASTAGELYRRPEVVNVPSDPQRVLERLLYLIQNPPQRILTVVGSDAPEMFRAKYPQANLTIFDINPRQLAKYRSKIRPGWDELFACDIGIPGQLTTLATRSQPQLIFLSNIWEYLSPAECSILATELTQTNHSAQILLTECHPTGSVQAQAVPIWQLLPPDTFGHTFEIDRSSAKVAHLLTR